MSNKRTTLNGIMSAMIAFGLVACGGKQADDKSSAKADETPAESQTEKTATALADKDFLLSTLSTPPGYTLQKTLGQHCRIFEHNGANYGERSGVTLNEGVVTTKQNGGNAWINLQFTTIPAVTNASGVLANPIVQVCGDMMVVEKS